MHPELRVRHCQDLMSYSTSCYPPVCACLNINQTPLNILISSSQLSLLLIFPFPNNSRRPGPSGDSIMSELVLVSPFPQSQHISPTNHTSDNWRNRLHWLQNTLHCPPKRPPYPRRRPKSRTNRQTPLPRSNRTLQIKS